MRNVCKCKKPGIVTDKTWCFTCRRPTPAAFEKPDEPAPKPKKPKKDKR
jgi:hypothetical protein